MSKSVEERFWAKVDKSGGPEACWIWTAGKVRHKYGRFHPKRGTSISAHRFSYELAYGPLPAGLFALHRCDNPPCVNPKHLFAGTHADNMKDMVQKGRQTSGSKNGFAKLTEEQVKEIRRLYAMGVSQVKLGKKFGVYQSNINLIVNRKCWTHI